MEYTLRIAATFVKDVKVKANSEKEAAMKVEDYFKEGSIAFRDDDSSDYDIWVVSKQGE